MSSKEPLHLIIADPSANVAEELVSELRNAGYATRAQHVDSLADLDEAITRQRWDLLVCRKDPDMEYDPEVVVGRVRQNELDFPVLLLENTSDADAITAGLQAGATDVILLDQDDRLLLVLARELANLAERRGRRSAELAMMESERRNQLLLDSSRAAISYVHEGMHIYANKTYVDMFGYDDADDLAAMPLLDMISETYHQEFKTRLKEYDVQESADDFPIEGITRSDTTFEARMTLSRAAYDGEPCMQVLIRRDDGGGATTAQLAEIRALDTSTGLVSRPYFIESVDEAVENARRDKGLSALFTIDIDNASELREEAGIAHIDNVLRELAEALRAACGPDMVLGRLGDNVFAGLIASNRREAVEEMGETMRKTAEELLASADKKTIQLTVSVGATMIGTKTASTQEAMDQSTRAVSRIREKDREGNAVYVFDPADFITAPGSKGAEDDERARETLRLLNEAIKANTLVLLYQPIISLHGEERELFEVYLRLPDAEGNLLTPNDFIQLAEQAGLGGRVDRWVALNALKSVSAARAEGRDTRVTINLTHAALTDESFLPWIRQALKAAKLPKEAVTFQYSEEAATTYLKQAKAFSDAMQEVDCQLSLSHFGCSVNPYGTLKHLKVTYVKLDGSFVRELENSEEKQEALTEMIRTLEEEHHKVAVIPMVANANVLSSLFTSGANYVQGNYFCEPLKTMEFDFSE